MKLFLHKMLVLIIGACFLSAYFELNDAEKEQNYEKESHSFISSVKHDAFTSYKHIEKAILPFLQWEQTFVLLTEGQRKIVSYGSSPPLLNKKLFLQHSVFLI